MMNIYVLNEDYEETFVIDTYESFIWTERFAELGEFELKMEDNRDVRSRLVRGTLLAIRESRRIMVVEDVIEDRNDSGTSHYTYKGPSFENILFDRVAYSESISSYKSRMNELVRNSLSHPIHSPDDQIRKLSRSVSNVYPPSTIAPSMERLPQEALGWSNVGDLHSDAVNQFPVGYRIIRTPDKRLDYDNYIMITDSLFYHSYS